MTQDLHEFASEAAQVIAKAAPKAHAKALQAGAERVVTQDPPAKSKRLWAAVSAACAAIAALPDVQALLVHYLTPALGEQAPVALAALSGVLAVMSKQGDKRPVRGKA